MERVWRQTDHRTTCCDERDYDIVPGKLPLYHGEGGGGQVREEEEHDDG